MFSKKTFALFICLFAILFLFTGCEKKLDSIPYEHRGSFRAKDGGMITFNANSAVLENVIVNKWVWIGIQRTSIYVSKVSGTFKLGAIYATNKKALETVITVKDQWKGIPYSFTINVDGVEDWRGIPSVYLDGKYYNQYFPNAYFR
jgi:hypothetical protein